jgi:hypothetical protein
MAPPADAAPVLAWRCWALPADPGALYSQLDPNRFAVRWRDGHGWQRPAWCAFHDHFAPDDGELCARCGWRGQPDLGELAWWLSDFKGVTPAVVGRVELGGTVLQGDHAHPEIPGILRAEYIRVHGPLVAAPGYEAHIVPLARRYGAEVLPSSARRFSPEWVQTVPADLGVDVRRREVPPVGVMALKLLGFLRPSGASWRSPPTGLSARGRAALPGRRPGTGPSSQATGRRSRRSPSGWPDRPACLAAGQTVNTGKRGYAGLASP